MITQSDSIFLPLVWMPVLSEIKNFPNELILKYREEQLQGSYMKLLILWILDRRDFQNKLSDLRAKISAINEISLI